MEFSSHARKRMQQRAMSLADVETIVSHGTQVRDEYLLREQDVKIADIPEHWLEDDASEERSAWLENKLPQTEREEVEARDRELFASSSSEDAGTKEG